MSKHLETTEKKKNCLHLLFVLVTNVIYKTCTDNSGKLQKTWRKQKNQILYVDYDILVPVSDLPSLLGIHVALPLAVWISAVECFMLVLSCVFQEGFKTLVQQQHCALVTIQNYYPQSSKCLQKNWLWCENKMGPISTWVVVCCSETQPGWTWCFCAN